MKKNLMSVLILALLIVNLILTAILTITILPQTKKSNELINQVCSAINLELQSGQATDIASIPMDQIVVYPLTNTITVNLKTGKDGAEHYAVITASLSMNSKNKDYSTYGSKIAEKESLIKNAINSTIGKYTMEELKSKQADIQKEVLVNLQKMFDSEFIVDVGWQQTIQ
jgi:flagellar FliL protein